MRDYLFKHQPFGLHRGFNFLFLLWSYLFIMSYKWLLSIVKIEKVLLSIHLLYLYLRTLRALYSIKYSRFCEKNDVNNKNKLIVISHPVATDDKQI